MVDGLHRFMQNRTTKPLASGLSGAGRGSRGGAGSWAIYPMYNVRLFGIVTTNPPCIRNIP
jgi:hypothetical protein